ncbi:hypothetical protein Z949_3153 [Sulfitobacter guttiformis KCTC 32187]|nr:hypothetical protein Z949_3153 [Sulfitobacter guttiformis KCTC 32187]
MGVSPLLQKKGKGGAGRGPALLPCFVRQGGADLAAPPTA